jgi:hypothetical protein
MNPKSPNPLHAVESGTPEWETTNRPNPSPYLKAILSGAARALNPGKMIRMIDDKTAASRYIKQSSFLRG